MFGGHCKRFRAGVAGFLGFAGLGFGRVQAFIAGDGGGIRGSEVQGCVGFGFHGLGVGGV